MSRKHNSKLRLSHKAFNVDRNIVLLRLKKLLTKDKTKIKLQELKITKLSNLSIIISYDKDNRDEQYKALMMLDTDYVDVSTISHFIELIRIEDMSDNVDDIITIVDVILELINHKYIVTLNN